MQLQVINVLYQHLLNSEHLILSPSPRTPFVALMYIHNLKFLEVGNIFKNLYPFGWLLMFECHLKIRTLIKTVFV